MPKGFDQKDFNGDSPYYIMFGPDICGSSTRKTHVIFNYKGENHLIKKEVPCETDEFSHIYTLVVKADNTYEVLIDGVSKQTGSLKEDWDMLPPKEIKDPEQSKPEDWVDERQIADPEDTKPEGYDDIPKEIPDPDASKPDDWDDELDGDWEPPMIDNPEYKGEWRPKMIENPEYKGEWVHPLVANPDYFDDDNLYKYDKIGAIGLEIWQVKAGTIFDNIIVTDSLEEATEFGKATLELQKVEKEKKEKEDEQRRAQEEAEAKAREEAAAAEAEDEEDDEKDEL
jgi:calreticulin